MSTTSGSNASTPSKARVMIGLARFSYANLFKARAVNEGDKEAYSVTLLIPKSDKGMIKKIEDAVMFAANEGKKAKFEGKDPKDIPKFKWPLHDGDEEKPGEPAYEGMMFINCRNERKPGVLVRKDGTNIEATEEDVYSGSYGYATVMFFAFNKKGKGIGASLQNVLKTKDGERLAGGPSAEADFAEFSEEDIDNGDDML